MTVYIALLRGINVSGQKLIKMVELKRMFEEMGFGKVPTYIQSGNVLFESEKKADVLRPQIEQRIEAVFGFQVTVAIRTLEEMERIVQHCPFPEKDLLEGEQLYISLLAETPDQKGIDRLLACSSEVDDYRIVGSEVHILLRQSIRKSMFNNNFLERKLGVPATTRNWQTTKKLVELGKAMKSA